MSARIRQLKKWIAVFALRLRATVLARVVADRYQAKTNPSGELSFPFIKQRRHPAVQILTYHRVNDDDDPFFPATPVGLFKQQMEYLADNYTVCTLDEVVKALPTGNLAENVIAITFDDGYRDNYLNAFPILKKLKLPATIFLATEAIDSRECLWHDKIFSAFRESHVLVLEKFGCDRNTYPLRTLAEKRNALRQVIRFLRSVDDDLKTEWIDRLRHKLGVTKEPASESLMLKWDEIRDMSKHGVGFGSHTITHPILTKVPLARAEREIEESKKVIESHLNLRVKHFAYPVGRRADLLKSARIMLRDAGYDSAVTSILGSNDSDQDLFELRRVTPFDPDVDSFALRLSYLKFVS